MKLNRTKTAILAILLAAGSMAAAAPGTTFGGSGSLLEAGNWDNGLPGAANPGLITGTERAWLGGPVMEFAVRQTGGTVVAAGAGNFDMRGGDGAGEATTWEIEDTGNSDFSYANLQVPGRLTMWSKSGGGQQLSVLAGYVDAGEFNAVSSPELSTVNIRDGVLRIKTLKAARVRINMLSNGSGYLIAGRLVASLKDNMILNFESGNRGTLTLLSKDHDGVPGTAGGTWQYLVNNGQVMIDGVVVKDPGAFTISSKDTATSISLAPK